MLMEYKDYAKTAREGGRGYATFNKEFLDEIMQITDINQLRVFLRIALDLDTKKIRKKKSPILHCSVFFLITVKKA